MIILFIIINPENNITPEKGRLLLSKPFLDDPYFKRTVVLLCEHSADGSFGLSSIDLRNDNSASLNFPEFTSMIP